MIGNPLDARAQPLDLRSEVIRLPDQRRLGMLQCGDPGGTPVFFFHDSGTSRLSIHPDETIARDLGVRLIAFDRPGIGLSDPLPGQWVVDWAKDVESAADWLGIGRFAVLGCGGGGPYALACAARLPDRVHSLGMVSSPSPANTDAMSGNSFPWLLRLKTGRRMRLIRRDPERMMRRLLAGMPAPDRELAAQDIFYTALLMAIVEAYARGGAGVWEDALVLGRSWGFEAQEVCCQTWLWHGAADPAQPVGAIQQLQAQIPGSKARIYATEGHLVYLRHWAEILSALTGEA